MVKKRKKSPQVKNVIISLFEYSLIMQEEVCDPVFSQVILYSLLYPTTIPGDIITFSGLAPSIYHIVYSVPLPILTVAVPADWETVQRISMVFVTLSVLNVTEELSSTPVYRVILSIF